MDEFPVPHYFGPYPNFATSQLPTVTRDAQGNIISVTGGIRKFIDSLPGLGPSGVNNLGQYIPIAVADKAAYPGCDYYEIALVEFEQQMHTDLQNTTLRGYVQLQTAANNNVSLHVALKNPDGSSILLPNGTQAIGVDKARYLGPTIVAQKDRPVRIKFYNLLPIGEGGDLFLPVDTTVMGSGMGPLDLPGMPGMKESYTQNRGTLHLHGGNTPWISDGTAHQWITPAGENTQYPEGVSVRDVPDMPTPERGAMTFYYTNQQSARLLFYHDHAYGITRLNVYAGEAAGYLITDLTEQALINSGIIPENQIPLIIQDKTFVPDNSTPITNIFGTFPSQLGFQDPTWDVNKWGGVGDLWYPHVYMTMQNPYDPSGMNTFGRWHYGPWFWPPTPIPNGPVPNPYYNASNPNDPYEPPMIPGVPTVSAPGEAFMDTPLVNGVAYPYLEVQPEAYRFRILNAADDRFYNLQLYVADNTTITPDGRLNTEVKMVPANFNATYPEGWPTDGRDGGVPDPTNIGPSFIQIGTEGGFLPAPIELTTLPVNWNYDQGTFDFGLVNQGTLQLGTAERADVIVDFSQFAGKTLILYNDNPAPSPAADPRLDYYTGNPDQTDSGGAPSTIAGYGPNTRTIMQIRVAAATPDTPYNLTALEQAFASTATTDGVFEASQKTIIVPQAAYSSAYNRTLTDVYAKIFDSSLTFTPINGTSPVTLPLQYKTIQDEMGEAYDLEYGRMAVLLGIELPKTQAGMQTMLLYNYNAPPTELVKPSIYGTQIGTLGDGTQIWKITHNGVDVHTVHWHMFDVQLVNRVAWDNNIRPPDPNELGWKDTIRVNPLQDTIVALRPIAPTIPFDLPNSIRPLDPTMPLGEVLKTEQQGFVDTAGEPVTLINHEINFGWEFVWHCHILAHEEMDMMRAISVVNTPRAPTGLTALFQANGVRLNWVDNSLGETNFTIQRAANIGFTSELTTFLTTENVTTYLDNTVTIGQTYYYRVMATNTVGDNWDYTTENPEAIGFPTMTTNSNPTNTATITSAALAFDFGTVASPLATGYTRVTHATAYTVGTGYGWSSTVGLQSRDRTLPDDLRRDFVFGSTDRTFNVDLPNGAYDVSVIIGDNSFSHNLIDVTAEGTLINQVTTPAGGFNTLMFTVTVADGQFNLLLHDAGGADPNWLINALVIAPAAVSTSENFDFGTGSSPIFDGYTPISPTNTYSAGLGYGWTNTAALGSRDRGAPDNLRRDFIFSNLDREFIVDLANGVYDVTIVMGDEDFAHDQMTVFAEGILQIDKLTTAANTFSAQTFTVTVSDGQLNLLFQDTPNTGNIDPNWVINGLMITPA